MAKEEEDASALVMVMEVVVDVKGASKILVADSVVNGRAEVVQDGYLVVHFPLMGEAGNHNVLVSMVVVAAMHGGNDSMEVAVCNVLMSMVVAEVVKNNGSDSTAVEAAATNSGNDSMEVAVCNVPMSMLGVVEMNSDNDWMEAAFRDVLKRMVAAAMNSDYDWMMEVAAGNVLMSMMVVVVVVNSGNDWMAEVANGHYVMRMVGLAADNGDGVTELAEAEDASSAIHMP